MKIKIFYLISILLLNSSAAFAAPAYGTRMPEQGKFFGGLQYHEIMDRELEGDNGSFNSRQYFALLSYGLFDWLSVDLKGGIADGDHQPTNLEEINYPLYLTGGYGFRVRLYQSEDAKTKAVFGFQHISVHPYAIDVNSDPRGEHFKTVIDDWQFSLLGSYALCKFTTIYGGGRWDRMDLLEWVDGERNRIKPENTWGVIVGADFNLNPRTWINVEGNFVDSEAYAVSLNYAF